MGPNTSVTRLRRQAGHALAALREAAGLSQKQVAEKLPPARAGAQKSQQSRISKFEGGSLAPSDEELRIMFDLYKATAADRAVIAMLVKESRSAGKNWWESYKDLLPQGAGSNEFFVCEDAAERQISYSGGVVPALLQTEEYARAVLELGHEGEDPRTIRRMVELRVKRSRVLDRDNPLTLDVTVSEAIVRAQVGSPAILKRQLQHILHRAESAHITIRVVPFESKYSWVEDRTHVFDFGDFEVRPVAVTEYFNGVRSTDNEKEVRKIRKGIATLKRVAMTPAGSIQLIQDAVKGL